SLYGPVIGSFVFIWLSESVSAIWARWPLLLGVAFVVVVLFLRGGVVEAWARYRAWRHASGYERAAHEVLRSPGRGRSRYVRCVMDRAELSLILDDVSDAILP